MKNKILKTCFVGCLATCLTLTGIFAFAPLGVSAQTNQNTNLNSTNSFAGGTSTTESAGLITPRADDPVLFTTESGLEIKYGNSLPDSYYDFLATENLAGFPYFTTMKDSNIFTWVVIGLNSSLDFFTLGGYLFKQWIEYKDNFLLSQYFQDNYYETISPVGNILYNQHNQLEFKSLIYDTDNLSNATPKVAPSGDDIPSNSILCLLNTPVEMTGWGDYYFTSDTNDVKSICLKYDTEDCFGFGAKKEKINLTTVTMLNRNSSSNYSSGSLDMRFFPLGLGATYNNVQYENFLISTYLPTETLRACGKNYWGRSALTWSGDYHYRGVVSSSGGLSNSWAISGSHYVRPACVMSLV